jgi:hypothetical protein
MQHGLARRRPFTRARLSLFSPEAFSCRRALRSSLSFRAAVAFVLSCGWAALRRAAAVVFGDVKRSALCLRGLGVSEALCACVACARVERAPDPAFWCVRVHVRVHVGSGVCACVRACRCYRDGLGVRADKARMFAWFDAAARQGHALAQA